MINKLEYKNLKFKKDLSSNYSVSAYNCNSAYIYYQNNLILSTYLFCGMSHDVPHLHNHLAQTLFPMEGLFKHFAITALVEIVFIMPNVI